MITYKSAIALTPAQTKIDESSARFKLIKAGRRFGKTKDLVRWTIKKALTIPHELHWYVAPTYRMASEIAWDEFMRQLDHGLIEAVNIQRLQIKLISKATIQLKGSESEDSLRGRRLGSLVMDEAAFQKPDVFGKILRPMLADLKAPARMATSPRRGWFSSMFEEVKSGRVKGAEAFHFTIYDNPHISPDEIEQIRLSTPSDVWRREYLAEEVESQGQVYTEFGNANIFQPSREFQGHQKYTCVVGVDWGAHDPTAVCWLHVAPNGHVIVSREHIHAGWDVERHADAMKLVNQGRAVDAHNVVLDRSAFRVEGAATRSIADAFREAFGYMFQRSEKDVDYGTNIVRRFLREGWLHVSESCPETIAAFREWEHSQHEPDQLAALRYGLAHAVMRKLTHLMDAPASARIDADAVDFRRYRLPLKKRVREQWAWDHASGVPS